MTWLRARCDTSACVEVATTGPHVYLRSSLAPDGVLRVSREEWERFATGVKAGDFDKLTMWQTVADHHRGAGGGVPRLP